MLGDTVGSWRIMQPKNGVESVCLPAKMFIILALEVLRIILALELLSSSRVGTFGG
jgi:hypothetical protein